MKKRWNKTTRVRTLTIESLDPRLCLAAGLGWAGVGEIQVDNAGAHVSHWHNPTRPHDVNQDRSVTPIDALLVVNTLNAGGARTLSAAEGEATALVDVNGDSQVTPADCLAVVNELNQDTVVGVTAEQTPSDDPSGDEVLADDGSVSTENVDEGTVDDDTVEDGTVDELPPGEHGCGDSHESRIADLFARADADEDGVLTEAELPPPLWERLSAADTDEDGQLTLDELTSFTPERGPHGPPHAGPGEGDALERFDQNDDGALTEDELPEKLWEHIAPADANGDGSISAEELAAYRPEPPPREDPFDCLDKDENGVLTEDELPQQVWDRLAGADIDGDGSISPEELAAYRPEPPPREDFFARLDKDDDGLLIEDELPPQLWERLSGADVNGDGSITPTELADASLALVPHERGPAPHRGGGPRPMMPFGGNARRF